MEICMFELFLYYKNIHSSISFAQIYMKPVPSDSEFYTL